MLKYKRSLEAVSGYVHRESSTSVEFIFMSMAFLSSFVVNNQLYNLQLKYHDMTVFFSYIVFYFLIGLPFMMCCVLLGQYGCGGIILVFRMVPFFRGAGYSMLLFIFVKCVIISRNVCYCLLVIKDIILSHGVPKWSNCSNFEYRGNCRDKADKYTMDITCCSYEAVRSGECFKSELLDYVSIEYFITIIMQNFDGSSSLRPNFNAVVALSLVWVFIYYCLIKNPETYLSVIPIVFKCGITLGILLLFSLLFSELNMDGFKSMSLRIKRWTDLEIWFESLESVIDNVEIGSGTLIYLGSYRHVHSDIGRDMFVIGIFKLLNLLCACIWSTFMLGIIVRKYKATDVDCVTLNKGLLFSYTGAMEGSLEFPAPIVQAALFFMFFLLQELPYNVVLMYCVQRSIMEAHPVCGRNRKYVTGVLCVLGFACSIILINDDSLVIQELIRHFIVRVNSSLLSVILALVIFVIYGVDTLCDDYEYILGYKIMKIWKLMWQITFPLLAMMVVFVFLKILPRFEAEIKSHEGCFEIFVIITVIIMLPIPVFAIVAYVIFAKKENMIGMFQADPSWGPNSAALRRARKRFDPKNAIRYKNAIKCGHKCLLGRKAFKLKRKELDENRKMFFDFIRSEFTA